MTNRRSRSALCTKCPLFCSFSFCLCIPARCGRKLCVCIRAHLCSECVTITPNEWRTLTKPACRISALLLTGTGALKQAIRSVRWEGRLAESGISLGGLGPTKKDKLLSSVRIRGCGGYRGKCFLRWPPVAQSAIRKRPAATTSVL
jgi:hypothetical protein